MDLPTSWVVLRVVFRALTCHLKKLLDQGKWGDDVVWLIH